MSFAAALEQATKTAVCGWLANGGNAAAATWIVNGSRTPWTAVAGGAAALGLLALNYGCNFDPDAGAPQQPVSTGCKKVTGGTMKCTYIQQGGAVFTVRNCQAVEVYGESATPEATGTRYQWTEKFANGTTYTGNTLIPNTAQSGPRWEVCSGTCVDSTPDGPITTTPPNYTYVDATTNCSYEVEFQAWVREDDGTARPVLKISPGSPAPFASGGIIGGCNFGPVIYAPGGGGGGGGPIVPWVPGDDGPNGEPWWWPVLQAALGRLAGAALEEVIRRIFGQDPALAAARATAKLLTGSESGLLPAVVYDLEEACPPDGAAPQVHAVPIPQAPALAGLAARSDALEVLAQDQKSWKQPICRQAPVLTGEWVTVNFVSDEVSPAGEKRLRKVFRYRDQTASPLLTHVQHWENFSWKAGPVIVVSQNLPWGSPKVWAESAAEGKRVIAHAAQVAGVDLADPRHEWLVSGSDDPRYGKPGTMRVDTRGGRFVRVTKRPGPDGLPTGVAPGS